MGTCLWELGCVKQPSRFVRLTPTSPLQKAGTVAHPGNPNTLGGDARLRLWRAGESDFFQPGEQAAGVHAGDLARGLGGTLFLQALDDRGQLGGRLQRGLLLH